MNLQLIKIKRQNAFDYSLLSEFMKKKNGKLIFTAGFGNAGKIKDNTTKTKLNLMQKFERNFQFASIIKAYNEAFHINPKKSDISWTPENIKIVNNGLIFPNLNKNRKTISNMKLNPSSTYNKFHNKKIILKNASISFNPNMTTHGKNTSSYFNKNNDISNDEENSVDYNDYFYNTLDYLPQGNNTISEKDFNTTMNKLASTTNCISNSKNNRNKKSFRNISQDCVYLFGKNKIIIKNKKEKSRNYMNIIGQKSEVKKSPFIDYNKEFDPYKTKSYLRKNFDFYRDKNKPYENFSEVKQEYIFKIRKIFENKKNVKYRYENLPSHKSVKNIIRKNKIFEIIQ